MSKLKVNVSKNDEVINMILFGESGVGKSTFINAISNYFVHNSFEDARGQPMSYLIPASFSMTDANYKQIKIEIGGDPNEKAVVGKAATQNAKSHYIRIAPTKVLHVIDTPGVGDPDGFDKDKENSNNTIKYISQYKKMNAICILMKPNNARLNIGFTYCLKELLVNLNKQSAPNIVFCFTNSRSNFYRPGDTYEPLKKLLQVVLKISYKVLNLRKNVSITGIPRFYSLKYLK